MTDNAKADPKLGQAPDPYPHLSEAVKSYLQDLTKAIAALLDGSPTEMLGLIQFAIETAAAVPADPKIAAAYASLTRRMNEQHATNYREATKAVGERFVAFAAAAKHALPGAAVLSERSVMALIDRAGVSAGLWAFDERGHLQVGPESPGAVDELLRGIQYGADVFKQHFPHQHVPAGAGRPEQAVPDLVPRPIVPPLDPSIVALRALVQRGDILWWTDDKEPDADKRKREAVPAIRPELWDRYEALFCVAEPGDVGEGVAPGSSDHRAFGAELTKYVERLRKVQGEMTPAKIVDVVTGSVAAWKDHATSAAPGDVGAVPLAIVWYERHDFADLVNALLPDAPDWRRRDIVEAFHAAHAAARKGGE